MARGTYRYRRGTLMAAPSLHLQIFRTLFALVWNDVVGDLVALTEVVQAGLLNGRNMDEHILTATAVRRDKTIPLSRVEPLHSTCRHVRSPFEPMATTWIGCGEHRKNLCDGDGRWHAVGRPVARPAPVYADQPYGRRCWRRGARCSDFQPLSVVDPHLDRHFDGSEKRSTGVSDFPARIVA